MLTLIHKSTIPKTEGMAKIRETTEKLYLSKILKIIFTIPAENKSENRYEYPIKCAEDDCCNMKVKANNKKINGKII